jgi:hypothetical protein
MQCFQNCVEGFVPCWIFNVECPEASNRTGEMSYEDVALLNSDSVSAEA